MANHDEMLQNHEKRIWKLERWQIKIAIIITGASIIVGAIVIWTVNYSLNKIADKILGG